MPMSPEDFLNEILTPVHEFCRMLDGHPPVVAPASGAAASAFALATELGQQLAGDATDAAHLRERLDTL